jgi:hypothetical protein
MMPILNRGKCPKERIQVSVDWEPADRVVRFQIREERGDIVLHQRLTLSQLDVRGSNPIEGNIMSRFRFALPIGGLVAVMALAGQPPRDTDPAWAEPLLKELKLTPATAQLEPNRWTGGGPHRLNTFQKIWDDWRMIDPAVVEAGKGFLTSADSFERMIVTAAPFIDVKPLPTAPVKADALPADAFPKAVAEFHIALGKPLTDEQSKDLAARSKSVPRLVADAATILLRTMPDAFSASAFSSIATVATPTNWNASARVPRPPASACSAISPATTPTAASSRLRVTER